MTTPPSLLAHGPARAATCAALALASAAAAQSAPARDDGARSGLDAAFAAAVPPAAETLWTRIPWRRSLTAALAESAATGKPVYLYVNDGDVDSGRC